jgi:hypothetical protein
LPAAIAGLGLAGTLLWAFAQRSRAGDARGTLARAVALAALPLLAAATAHVAIDYLRWQRLFGSPMLDQSLGFLTPLHVGLFGFLLSPGCSIIAYSPLLLVAPQGFHALWRDQRAECLAALGIPLTFLLVCSTYLYWTGLWSSPGPRYLFIATPLLLLPLGPLLDRIHSRAQRAWVGGLAVAGLLVQLSLMTSDWPAVIQLMDWQRFGPLMSFVFVADQSPILGSARALFSGHVDVWLWNLGRGTSAAQPQPLAALLVAIAWAALVAFAGRQLQRALAEPEPRSG